MNEIWDAPLAYLNELYLKMTGMEFSVEEKVSKDEYQPGFPDEDCQSNSAIKTQMPENGQCAGPNLVECRTENTGLQYVDKYYKNIHPKLHAKIEDLIDETHCRIERKEWKSKYNSYIVYDYEPFDADGFEINILVSANNINNLMFFDYLYTKLVDSIALLDLCWNTESGIPMCR
jgi:hypothetical protein